MIHRHFQATHVVAELRPTDIRLACEVCEAECVVAYKLAEPNYREWFKSLIEDWKRDHMKCVRRIH